MSGCVCSFSFPPWGSESREEIHLLLPLLLTMNGSPVCFLSASRTSNHLQTSAVVNSPPSVSPPLILTLSSGSLTMDLSTCVRMGVYLHRAHLYILLPYILREKPQSSTGGDIVTSS